jgi:hypothetical protein
VLNSKIYSLLKEFDLIDPCYQDPYDARFTIAEFLDTCDELERNWTATFSRKIHLGVEEKNAHQNEYVRKICAEMLSSV